MRHAETVHGSERTKPTRDFEINSSREILTLNIIQRLPQEFVLDLASAAGALVGHTPTLECKRNGINLLFRCSKLHQHLVCSRALHAIYPVNFVPSVDCGRHLCNIGVGIGGKMCNELTGRRWSCGRRLFNPCLLCCGGSLRNAGFIGRSSMVPFARQAAHRCKTLGGRFCFLQVWFRYGRLRRREVICTCAVRVVLLLSVLGHHEQLRRFEQDAGRHADLENVI